MHLSLLQGEAIVNGIRPGDRVIYRDIDRFGVAKVDLVKERHVTAFHFDTRNRRWARLNRRIGFSFILAKLPAGERADSVASRIDQLNNEREAQRQIANRIYEERIRQLINAETPHP